MNRTYDCVTCVKTEDGIYIGKMWRRIYRNALNVEYIKHNGRFITKAEAIIRSRDLNVRSPPRPAARGKASLTHSGGYK